MAFLKLALRRETMPPVLALMFASVVCLGMVVMRMYTAKHIRYNFLAWNLFLAWLPLVFALLAVHTYKRGRAANWWFSGFAVAWLLFFPNAQYIFTDIIHLTTSLRGQFWVDLVVILSCAFTGLFAGFLSLFLMHALVRQSAGAAAGWVFIAGAAAFSGLGVYIGRFLRFNSWDVLYRPGIFFHDVSSWFINPHAHPSVTFPMLFAAFIFISYLMLYALTHVKSSNTAVESSGT